MTWKNEKFRHGLAKRKILTANGKFLSENHPNRQSTVYPEYAIEENTIQYIPEEDLDEIYEKSRNQMTIIHYPNLNAKMIINANRIGYEEIVYELPEFSDYEERDNILTKIYLYGEVQKMKAYKDNIYRTYSTNYNNKTKRYEVKIELLGDTIKDIQKPEFLKTMKAIENQSALESINAIRYFDQITMKGLL